MGSNGSVIPFFINKAKEGQLPITDKNMTRFNISLDEGVDIVFYALAHAWGGEIFVPKIPSYKITDVANAICPNCKKIEVGIRPGEKLHEEMITSSDSFFTYDLGKYYVILPTKTIWDINKFIKKFNAKKVPNDFCYHSRENTEWETIESLREKIKLFVNPNFEY